MILPKSEEKQLQEAGFSQFFQGKNRLEDMLETVMNYARDFKETDFYITRGKYVGAKERYVIYWRNRDR